jgi:hypothetical protein
MTLYEQWIQFLFDRPETTPEWYWDSNVGDFDASNEKKVMLISQTFLRCGTDLTRYNDTQVANGLKYILSNSVSNTPFILCQKGVAEVLRVEAVLHMKHLYRDCFAKRCSRSLSHLGRFDSRPLNLFCYMLWDVSPLRGWKDVVLDVMEDALYIPHDACIESALHGLGHRYSQDKSRVPEIINHFLSKTTGLRPELRTYARQAQVGMIQ